MNLGKAGKIREHDSDAVRARSLGNKAARRLGPDTVATGHNDPHSSPREAQRGMKPDPGARPGDNSNALGSDDMLQHLDRVACTIARGLLSKASGLLMTRLVHRAAPNSNRIRVMTTRLVRG